MCRNPQKHLPDDAVIPPFDVWLERIEGSPALGLYRPMASYLTGLDGEPWMDYIGRYESLEQDFAHVCGVLEGLAGRQVDYRLPRINYTRHASWQEVYSCGMMELVARLYRRDFELWYPDSLP
jgi:hypothetical protein